MQQIITEKDQETFITAAESYIIQLIRSPFFFLKSDSINLVYMKKNNQGF